MIQVPGYEYDWGMSEVLTEDRALNIYTYFLKSLAFLDLPGNIAEFGVYEGHTSRELCRYLNHVRSTRKLYMFDTFAGLPTPSQYDPSAGGQYVGTLDTVRHTMLGLSGYTLLPGLISDFIPMESFQGYLAFAHIDCDLYQGTRDAIEICQKRMFKGAYIVIDDYETEWFGVSVAVNEMIHNSTWETIVATKGQFIARKRSDPS